MTTLGIALIEAQIAAIDKKFETALHWGSWMADASHERQRLVREAKKLGGVVLEDKYVLTRGEKP
jgi:hypothetical protein